MAPLVVLRRIVATWMGMGLALVCACAVAGSGPWFAQRFTAQNGLPQNSVIALAMDSAGYLWATTEGGLVRFDGREFKQFSVSDPFGVRSERMREIVTTFDGELLVSDARGNLYMIHGHHVVFPINTAQQNRFALQGGGIGTHDLMLALMHHGERFPGQERWQEHGYRIVPLDADRWLIAGTNTVLLYEDTLLVGEIPGRAHDLFRLNSTVYGFGPGDMPFRLRTGGNSGTCDQVGLRVDGGTLTRITRSFWRSGEPHAVVQGGDSLFLITAGADATTLVARHFDMKLPQGCLINDVLYDPASATLFIATDTKGLWMYRRETVRRVADDRDPARPGNSFYAQVVSGDSLLIGFHHDRAALFDRSGRFVGEIPGAGTRGCAIDAQGMVLFSRADSVMRFDPRSRKVHAVARAGSAIYCFLVEGDTIWVGTEDGIMRLIDGRITLSVPSGPERERTRPIMIRRGPDGLLWYCSCNGVFRCARDMSSASVLKGTAGLCVRSMITVGDRTFLGTYGDGVFVLESDKLIGLPRDKRGFLTHTHAILPDRNGRLWFSTNQGMLNAKENEISAFLAGDLSDVYFARQDPGSGLFASEFNGGCDPPWAAWSDGTVCFPSLNGSIWFDPDSIPDAYPKGPIMLEATMVDGLLWPVDEYSIFPARTGEVEVQFGIAYWGDPNDLKLEFRAPGLQEEWYRLPTGQRTIRFLRPPPGDYELTIRKVGSTTRHDPAGSTSYWFRIREPWYKSVWAFTGFAAGALVLFFLAMKWNAARLRRKNMQLEEAVDQRTRELSAANRALRRDLELKDRLFSVFNHDIISPLRFITRVARSQAEQQIAEKGAENSAMKDISFASEKLYVNAQNLLNWIKQQDGRIVPKPRHVVVNLLVAEGLDRVRAQASEKGLSLVNEVPLDDVLMVDPDLLSIALNNLLMNAVSYTSSGMIRVSASLVDQVYHLIVKDTGPGFSPKAMEQITRIRRSGPFVDEKGEGLQGLGYIIVSGIMALLGGDFEVVGEPTGGTTIVLSLPTVPPGGR